MQRVDLFAPGIAKRKKHTLASVVSVMNAAATQDLRVVRSWPLIRAVLAGGAAPTQRAEAAARAVDAWRARGGSRIDLQLDGKVDDPGAAVLDAAWKPLTEAVLSPVLGTLTSRLERLMPRDDAAGPGWLVLHRGLVRLPRQGSARCSRTTGERSLLDAVLRRRRPR